MIHSHKSLILLASIMLCWTRLASGQQTNCDGLPTVSLTCTEFQAKLAIPTNFTDTQCYRITDESCVLSLTSVPGSRTHTYPGLFFNQLSFAPVDRTWNGSLVFKKLVGESVTLNNLRVTGALRVLSGKVSHFDSARSHLGAMTLESAFIIPGPDRLLFNTRKSFGTLAVQANSNLQDSYFTLGKAATISATNVNLANSRINADADLSAMIFRNVRLNGFSLVGEGVFQPPRFQIGAQVVSLNLSQFLSLTKQRLEQAELDVLKVGSLLDLRGLSMAGKDLRGLDFKQSTLDRVDFSGADLRSADLRGAKGILDPVQFQSAQLDGAKFCVKDLPVIMRSFNTSELVAKTKALVLELGGEGCPGEAPNSRLNFLASVRTELVAASAAEFEQASLALHETGMWPSVLLQLLEGGSPVQNVLAENARLLAQLAQSSSRATTPSPLVPADLCRAFDRLGSDPNRKYLQDYVLDLLPIFNVHTQGLTDLEALVKRERSNPANLDNNIFPNRQVNLLAVANSVQQDNSCELRGFATSVSSAIWLRFKYLETRFKDSETDESSPLLGPSPTFIFVAHTEDPRATFTEWFKNDTGMWLAFLKKHFLSLYLIGQSSDWQTASGWTREAMQKSAQAIAKKADQWQAALGGVTITDIFASAMNISLTTELRPLDMNDAQLELSLAGDILASMSSLHNSTRPARIMAIFLALESTLVPTRTLEILSLSEGLSTPFYSYFAASIRNTNELCTTISCGDPNAVYRLAVFLQYALVQDQIIYNREITESRLYELLLSSLDSVTGVSGISEIDLSSSFYSFDIFQSLLSRPDERYQLFMPIFGADKRYLAQDGDSLLRFQFISGDGVNASKWTSFQRTSIRDTDCLIDACETPFGRGFPDIFQPSSVTEPNPLTSFTKADHRSFTLFYALRSALRLQFLVPTGSQPVGSANNALRFKSVGIIPADSKEKSNAWLIPISLIHDIPVEAVPARGSAVNFASQFAPVYKLAFRATIDTALESSLKSLDQYLIEKGGIATLSPAEPSGLKAFDTFIKQIGE